MSGNAFIGEVAPASHSLRKNQMWSTLAELDTNPEFFSGLMERIADGEFMAALAADCAVNHSILRNWIRGNKERERAFIEADRQGRARRAEKVLESTYEIATKANDAPISRMEQLRAAEIMLKQQNPSDNKARVGDINIVFVAARDGKQVEGAIIDQLP